MILGKYPRGRADLQAALDAAIRHAKSLGYVTLPDGVEIAPLELASRSSSDFATAIRDLRHEIFLGITGAILQALEGAHTGARSIGEVHRSTADTLVWHLAAAVADILNEQLVPELVDLNFQAADYPKVSLSGVNDAELKISADVDAKLQAMGLVHSRKNLYGRQPPLDWEDHLPDPKQS
jgi:phage gp29-like protein